MQNEQDNDIQGHINFRIIRRICACDTVAAKPNQFQFCMVTMTISCECAKLLN